MLPPPRPSLPSTPPQLQTSPVRWRSRANLSQSTSQVGSERHSTTRPARCRSPLLSSPLPPLVRPAVSLPLSSLPSSRGRADGFPFTNAGRESEGARGAEGQGRQRTNGRNEAEVRNVGGKRAAKSDGRGGVGGGGRKWQQQVRRRRRRRLGRHLTNIIHVESKWKGQVCIGWQPCDSPTGCGKIERQTDRQGERNFARY